MNGAALESENQVLLKKARRILDQKAISAEFGISGIVANKLLYEHTDGIRKPVIPGILVQEILMDIHRTAHLGKHRNIEMFRRSFYSELTTDTLRQLLGNCAECAMYKPKTQKNAKIGNLNSETPWHTIGIDIMHMTESSGYKYVLIVICHFTKWLEAIPLKYHDVDTVLAELKNLFRTFGEPNKIVADNAFYARNLKTYCEAKDIELHIAIPHQHSGNARAERVIGTIRPLMNIVLSQDRNWVTKLPKLVTEYRNTISNVTGFTPQYLMFARERRDNALANGLAPLRNETQSQNWLRVIDQRAERIQLLIDEQKRREHTSTKVPTTTVGEFVVIKNQQRQSKDQAYFDKIYTVEEVDDQHPRLRLKLKPYKRKGPPLYRHVDQVKKIDPIPNNDINTGAICLVIGAQR